MFSLRCFRRLSQSLDAIGAARLTKGNCLTEDEIEEIWQQHGLRYSYDLAGRLISRTNALKQTSHYFYNEAGFLYTLNADGEVTEFTTMRLIKSNRLIATAKHFKVI